MAYRDFLRAAEAYYKSKFAGREIDDRLTDVPEKQDIITDLDEIREGAAKGETAYQLPEDGIPMSDLSEGVNASLDKADTAVQDPDYVHTDNNYTDADKTEVAKIGDIEALIPPQASEDNQLADKNFVNSSVATNTANFIGTFNSVADLEAYSGNLTNNDYAFVITTDAYGNTAYDRYKYNASEEEWLYEYTLNNSSFTAEQWAAINSGMTASLVSKLSALPTNDELTTALNGKVDKVANKGLSTNDYTDADKADVAKIDIIEGEVTPAFEDVALTFRRTRSGALSKGTGMAAIRRIKGNTVVFNQLVQNGNFADTSNWSKMPVTATITASNNKLLYTAPSGVSLNARIEQSINTTANHKYLISAFVLPSVSTRIRYSINPNVDVTYDTTAGNRVNAAVIIQQDANNGTVFQMYVNDNNAMTEGSTIQIDNLIINDLTLTYGPGNEPTLEAFKVMFPLLYYAYDAGSILNVQSTGVMTTGQNIWDEVWELGSINSDGQNTVANCIRSKNYIPAFGNTAYNIYCVSVSVNSTVIYFYDANKSLIPYTGEGAYANGYNGASNVFTTPIETAFMRFRTALDYGTTYKNNICINISNPAINGTYQPYRGFTSLLPITTITGKKDGLGASDTPFANGLNGLTGVFDTIDVKGGIKRFARVDLGSLSWNTSWYSASGRLYVNLSGKAPGLSNIAYPLGPTAMIGDIELIDKAGICGNAELGYIYIGQGPVHTDSAAFITSLSGVYAIFELATPEHWVWDSPMHPFYPYDNTGTEAEVPQGTASTPQLPLPIEVDYEPNGVSFQAHQLEILQGQ